MKKKILVIEDDLDIAELVKLVLETDSFTVNTIQDPTKALAYAVEWQPDAIFLDLTMPELDGWELFKLFRNEKQFDNVPIAILTAKTEEIDAMVGLTVMNADAYIKKPFGKQELIDRTHELFRNK